jgi:hypothetical protein
LRQLSITNAYPNHQHPYYAKTYFNYINSYYEYSGRGTA